MELDSIFKSYDIRGLVPSQFDEEVATLIGAAFADFSDVPELAVGRDCRESSPSLAAAFSAGVTSRGTNVRDLGITTTDMVSFAAGFLDMPGAMITASHNPKSYNGIKLCLAGAAPVGIDTGLTDIKAMASSGLTDSLLTGEIFERALLDEYLEHMLGIVDPSALNSLRVVVDGGNGVAGVVVPSLFDRLPAELVGLYLEPDGTFPNHHPDPLRPENLLDLKEKVRRVNADIGVAFDGDADRIVIVDDEGRSLSGSAVTAIAARWFLSRNLGASIVHNLICSKAVPEIVTASGGVPVRTRVGHSYIKAVMAETDAVFGGEHSGHYYFRENYRADSGILAMLILLLVLSEDGRKLSVLRREFEPYAQSGEVNFRVDDPEAVVAAIAGEFPDADIDYLDGITVDLGTSWFNLRSSNTEPALRLNAEAPDHQLVDDLVAQVGKLIGEAV